MHKSTGTTAAYPSFLCSRCLSFCCCFSDKLSVSSLSSSSVFLFCVPNKLNSFDIMWTFYQSLLFLRRPPCRTHLMLTVGYCSSPTSPQGGSFSPKTPSRSTVTMHARFPITTNAFQPLLHIEWKVKKMHDVTFTFERKEISLWPLQRRAAAVARPTRRFATL